MEKFRKILSAFHPLLLITLLVSGCAKLEPYHVAKDIAFGTGSPDAIVILGLKSAYPDPGLLAATEVVLSWGRLKRGETASDAPGAFSVSNTRSLVGIRPAPSEDMTWHILRLQPGTYRLYEAEARRGNSVRITGFKAVGAPFFTLQAGEVRYIGDLHWDAKSYPAKLAKLTRNDAAMQELLAQHAGITAKPYFRAPAIILPNSTAATFIAVSE